MTRSNKQVRMRIEELHERLIVMRHSPDAQTIASRLEQAELRGQIEALEWMLEPIVLPVRVHETVGRA